MQAVRQSRTAPEQALASALWRAGIRGFRRNDRRLPGSPDFAFWGYRLAVFVDGGFWHGHPASLGRRPLSPYWTKKIAGNVERDRRAGARLRELGWEPLRIWDRDIAGDLTETVARVKNALGR